jgi:rhamnulokinase
VSFSVGAVDFGASSIRVCRVTFDEGIPHLEVVHRFAHAPVHDGTNLRWDWDRLVAEMERGLQATLDAGPLASIGIDTWGVDYGLLDRHGDLIEPPISYRDQRTDDYLTTLDRIGARHFFATTGIQPEQFATVFQLAAHGRDQLTHARHVLLLPELLVHHLTGAITSEYSSAGTTGLLDIEARAWSDELAEVAGISADMLAPLAPAGTQIGTWHGVPVHLVGGHDTASAVLAGADQDRPFVATGTWLLVGRELGLPDTSDGIARAGLSNEIGALGGVRLQRNVAGWWLVEECRRLWGMPPLEDLLSAASRVDNVPVADALDPRLLAPEDMVQTLSELAGLPDPTDRATVTRCAINSMAAATARVLTSLPGTEPARYVDVFGGGAGSSLLLDTITLRTRLQVALGPVEAAALGNALAQAVALGAFASVNAARATLAPGKVSA